MNALLWLTVINPCWLPEQPQPTPQFQQTISFVQKLQAKSGGFRLKTAAEGEKASAPTLRATSAAVRALKYFGGKVPDKDAAAKFVASCHDAKSGGFANLPGGTPDVFSTAIGLMAVVELGMPLEKYKDDAVKYLSDNSTSFEDIRIAVAGLEAVKAKAPKAAAWLDLINKMQHPDGTFGKGNTAARDTGGAVVAILRLGGEVKHKDNVLKVLKAGQHDNGAWGKDEKNETPDLESSYRVMRAFHMLKALPNDVEGIRTFVEKCRNNDGGYSVGLIEDSTVSGCYYAGIIHHWLKDKK
jgi:prenyltransferase beta subunit